MDVPEPGEARRFADRPMVQARARPAYLTTLSTARRSVLRSLPKGWWVYALLFACTAVTTTVFGFALAASFAAHRSLGEDFIAAGYERLSRGGGIWAGVVYSAPLLLILLSHEFGHYFTCRTWKVEASLPVFGPSLTLLGTIGAFIRIRSPIYSRRSLFDIGVSGPIAGFTMLIPFLVAGVWMSRVAPAAQATGAFGFGAPLLLRAMESLRFPGVAAANISLHPMAMAAWAGLLATAINLIPVGQLDGGHISYAMFGERWHRKVSLGLIALLALMGFLYWPWWGWAVALFFFRRHPLIYDHEPLGPARQAIGATALVLFIISISIVPVQVR